LSGSQVIKRRAEVYAAAFDSTIQELRVAGFVSRRALADELNQRKIPTACGGRWHYTTVVRMLRRLGLLTSGGSGRINNGQAAKPAADARAKMLARTIRALQAKGIISFAAIARELNQRAMATALRGKWHGTSVKRLLERLGRLDRA
jgi:Recombinase